MKKSYLKSIAVNENVFDALKEFCDAQSLTEAFVHAKVFVQNLKFLKDVKVPKDVVNKLNNAYSKGAIIRFYVSDSRFFDDSDYYNCYFADVPENEYDVLLKMCDGEGYNEIFIRYHKLLNYGNILGLNEDAKANVIVKSIRSDNIVNNGDYIRFVKE